MYVKKGVKWNKTSSGGGEFHEGTRSSKESEERGRGGRMSGSRRNDEYSASRSNSRNGGKERRGTTKSGIFRDDSLCKDFLRVSGGHNRLFQKKTLETEGRGNKGKRCFYQSAMVV